MNPHDDNGWQDPKRGGRPRLGKHLRLIHPMKTRFRDDDIDWIGQALALVDESYSAWSRHTLVDAAKRIVQRDRSQT